MHKKLKAVVKSHYSHEIRKDVSLTELKSLRLEDAWPFMREEIESEIGSNQLVCVPHITETELYGVTSLFLQTRGGALRPLGALSTLVDRERTAPCLLQHVDTVLAAATDKLFKFPHESVKITLQDESIKNKVRVIMVSFTRDVAPPALLSTTPHHLHLRRDASPYLKGDFECKLFMVSSALRVGTLEFRATRASSSRIFHLGNPSPLVFALHRFTLTASGKLLPQGAVSQHESLQWLRHSSGDYLFTTDEANADLYK